MDRLLFALIAALGASQPSATAPPSTVDNDMTLELIVTAPEEPFSRGGAMPLALSVRNTGGGATDAPSPGFESPFEYLILSEDGARTVALVSAHAKRMAAARGLVPRAAIRMQSLAPGAAILYKADLAAFLVEPLPVGRYQLEARFRFPDKTLLVSNRVPFDVAAPRPTSWGAALDADGASWLTIDVVAGPTGDLVLRKRRSPPAHPGREPFHELHRLPAEPAVAGIAIALDVEPAEDFYGHWTAWLAGGRLHAGIARAVDLRIRTDALDLGLDEPTLLPVGYQFADAHAVFVVFGSASGGPALRVASIPADDEIAAQVRSAPWAPPVLPKCAVLTDEDLGPRSLLFGWVTSDHRLWLGRTSLLGEASDAEPAAVYSASTPVVAWQLQPVIRASETARLQLVEAPAGPGQAHRLVEVDAGDPGRITARDLPASAWAEAAPARWILTSPHRQDGPVAVLAADRLWIWRPGGSAWVDAGISVAGATGAAVWPAGGGFMLSWLDPERGYDFLRLLW